MTSTRSDVRPRPSPQERARTCMRAVDKIWERCQRGIDVMFPAPTAKVTPDQQHAATRWFMHLVNAAHCLERTAIANDPTAVDEWVQQREAYYHEQGWDWPGDRPTAIRTRAELIQMAMEV